MAVQRDAGRRDLRAYGAEHRTPESVGVRVAHGQHRVGLRLAEDVGDRGVRSERPHGQRIHAGPQLRGHLVRIDVRSAHSARSRSVQLIDINLSPMPGNAPSVFSCGPTWAIPSCPHASSTRRAGRHRAPPPPRGCGRTGRCPGALARARRVAVSEAVRRRRRRDARDPERAVGQYDPCVHADACVDQDASRIGERILGSAPRRRPGRDRVPVHAAGRMGRYSAA